MYTKELNTLARQLRHINCTAEAKKVLEILKFSQAYTVEDWQAVLEEINTPMPKQLPETAIKYTLEGAKGFAKAIKGFRTLAPENYNKVIEIAKDSLKIASYKDDEIIKMAKIFTAEKITKQAQFAWLDKLKERSGEYAAKLKANFRLMPFVGFLLGGIMALKNLAYGWWAYQDLVKESEQIGLTAFDTLDPQKIWKKVQEFSGNPDKLKIAVKTSKYAKVFVDEGISFVANSIDAVKDLAFAFGEIMLTLTVAGAAAVFAVDIGLSVLFMYLEYQAELSTLGNYDAIIAGIGQIAASAIQNLQQSLPEESGETFESIMQGLSKRYQTTPDESGSTSSASLSPTPL